MNWKKHECSLLKVVSDVGSTPAASTIYKLPAMNNLMIRPPDLYKFCTIDSTQPSLGTELPEVPMLSVYTRHAADCAKAKDKDWRRCRCPKWISGTHDGKFDPEEREDPELGKS